MGMRKENQYSQGAGGWHRKSSQGQIGGPRRKDGSNDKGSPEVSRESQMCLPEKAVGSHNFSQGAVQVVVLVHKNLEA